MFYKFLTFGLICAVVRAEEISLLGETFEKCAKENNLAVAEVKKYVADNMPEAESSKYKCFYKCVLQSLDLMDANGVVDELKFVQREPTIVRSCASLEGTDLCDKAHNVFKCVITKLKDHGDSLDVSSKCYLELGSDDRELHDMLKNNRTETDNQKVKCYFKCIYQGFKWMDEEGNLDKGREADYSALTKEEIEKLATCYDVTGKDACDKAFNFHMCGTKTLGSLRG